MSPDLSPDRRLNMPQMPHRPLIGSTSSQVDAMLKAVPAFARQGLGVRVPSSPHNSPGCMHWIASSGR